MTDARCEPPPELRGVPGYHWVETPSGSRAMIVRWGVIAQAWQFLSDETPYPLLGFRYLSPVLTPTEVAALRADAQAGWIYHNPDTGMEWAENHPVESGEVPDATCIQAATAPYLAEQLKRAWGDSFALRAERDAAVAENHRLKTGNKLLADTVRSWGWENRKQESNGELVGRALWEQHSELTTLRAEVEKLKRLLEECANDLAMEIDSRYPNAGQHPSEAKRRDRDMEIVNLARAELNPEPANAVEVPE